MSDAGSSPTSTVVSPTPPSARTRPRRARGCAPRVPCRPSGSQSSGLEPIRSGSLIALVFSYEVSDAAEFERVYGPEGDWAEFFRGGRGYIGTELLRDVEHPGRYLVIDRWESARGLRRVRRREPRRVHAPRRRDGVPLPAGAALRDVRERVLRIGDRRVRERRTPCLLLLNARSQPTGSSTKTPSRPSRRPSCRPRRPASTAARGLSRERAGRRRGCRRPALRHDRDRRARARRRPRRHPRGHARRPPPAAARRGSAPLELAHAGAGLHPARRARHRARRDRARPQRRQQEQEHDHAGADEHRHDDRARQLRPRRRASRSRFRASSARPATTPEARSTARASRSSSPPSRARPRQVRCSRRARPPAAR